MIKIRVLPEILANKIAAGEIVERPASVVKELIENSIDAKSSSIHIEILSGGKKLILVRDNGEGMDQDDAILAFEHHATSKLQTVEDLGAIATLGFRGEALPSIASISRLLLKTRQASDQASIPGTELEIQGGTLRTVKPVAYDKGTEVTVRDLFFNVPARRKFLRSNQTELGHITRLVTNYAIAHPEIRFTLDSENHSLIDVVPVASVRERLYQLFGEKYLENLFEVDGRTGSVQLHGFSSRPHEQRSNSYSQFFYVNRRIVRDKLITSAVRKAYRNCIPASAYPVVLLFLKLPYDQVDVNAHPAKTEIRFRDQRLIHDLIFSSIERALIQNSTMPVYQHNTEIEPTSEYQTERTPQTLGDAAAFQQGSPLDFTQPPTTSSQFQKIFNYPFKDTSEQALPSLADHFSMRVRPELLFNTHQQPNQPFDSNAVRILGQLKESYIIASDSDGLLIIDQHVAHERILYEKLATAMQNNVVETQGLLVPLSLELPPHQIAMVERILPELHRNGFQIENFGGNTVLIRSVPAIAKDYDNQRLLAEILEGLEMEERTLDVERIRDRIAVSTACRAAVKANMPLTLEKMQWLLDGLSLTRMPTHCPHGRPVILRFSLHEIERNFGRI